MKLLIDNIGKINNAEILINGLTIIAGENNSGKSTISKSLYSAFNSLNKINENVFEDRISSFLSDLKVNLIKTIENSNFEDKFHLDNLFSEKTFIKKIHSLFLSYKDMELTQKVEQFLIDEFKKWNLTIYSNNVTNVLDTRPYMDINSDIIKTKIATNLFRAEFSDQINNIYEENDAKVTLQIGERVASFHISDNKVYSIETNNLSLEFQAIYIDDLHSIDTIQSPSRKKLFEIHHKTALTDSFFNFYDNNITATLLKEEKLSKIFSLINSFAKGDIVYDTRLGVRYDEANSQDMDKSLALANVSAGQKTFILLKELILNGAITDNGTIIFDEPEIHLHPEWQIKFAELIVLLQKEYKLHIVLTTHSPYFLYALEVFSTKYGIANLTNYYFTHRTEESIKISNVDKNLEIIYSALNKPFQTIEDLTNELY